LVADVVAKAEPEVVVHQLTALYGLMGSSYGAAARRHRPRGVDVTDRMVSVGLLTPHAAVGPEAEFPEMAPGRVATRIVRISEPGATPPDTEPPTSPSGLRALTAPGAVDEAAIAFPPGSVEVVAYASTTSAYAIGYGAESDMVGRLAGRLGLPVVATCLSAVRAMRVVNVERVALVHPPWFDDELNELGAAYFRSQGFTVVASELADLPNDPGGIESGAVIEWVSQNLSDAADVVFIGGNGFRAAGAVEALEARVGRPVLESNQVLLWSVLIEAGSTVEIRGYGSLFARR
jgi:maleate isomerase